MGKIYKNGILFAGSTDSAKSVAFDNTDTGLEADNVQEAIEEVKNKTEKLDVTDSILLANGISMRYGTLFKIGNLMVMNCLLISETPLPHNVIWMTISDLYLPSHNLNGAAGGYTGDSYTDAQWSINCNTGVLRSVLESGKNITQMRLNISWVI